MPVGGGEDSPLYEWLADTVRTLLPRLLERGAVTEEEVSIDTLAARLRTDAVGEGPTRCRAPGLRLGQSAQNGSLNGRRSTSCAQAVRGWQWICQ
jgi:hypothetical protein